MKAYKGRRHSFILNHVTRCMWIHNITEVIPQSLQLPAQVRSVSLGWCHISGGSAKLCVYRSVCWRCQYLSAYVAAAIMWLRLDSHKVWETQPCHAKWQWLCGFMTLSQFTTSKNCVMAKAVTVLSPHRSGLNPWPIYGGLVADKFGLVQLLSPDNVVSSLILTHINMLYNFATDSVLK